MKLYKGSKYLTKKMEWTYNNIDVFIILYLSYFLRLKDIN